MEAKELVKVIKACKEAGVFYFKEGELEISFKAPETEYVFQYPSKTVNQNPIYEEFKEEIKKQDQDLEEEMLVLEDPVEWEQRELKALSD